jgi:hypothetical protein
VSVSDTGGVDLPAWGHACGLLALDAAAHVDAAQLPDRVLLADRMSRYCWAFDERRPDLLSDCFTGDATWKAHLTGASVIGPFSGRDAVVEFMLGFWPGQADQRRHMVTNVVVQDQGPLAATVLSYHLVMSASRAGITPVTCGFYNARMTRDGDGQWRIRRLVAGYDIPF